MRFLRGYPFHRIAHSPLLLGTLYLASDTDQLKSKVAFRMLRPRRRDTCAHRMPVFTPFSKTAPTFIVYPLSCILLLHSFTDGYDCWEKPARKELTLRLSSHDPKTKQSETTPLPRQPWRRREWCAHHMPVLNPVSKTAHKFIFYLHSYAYVPSGHDSYFALVEEMFSPWASEAVEGFTPHPRSEENADL